MTGDEIARLVYLSLLVAAVIGWAVAENRQGIGSLFRKLLVWGFIFLGLIGAYGLWNDIRTEVAPRQLVLDGGARIEVPRAFDGHYYVTLDIDEAPVDFVVDTGATDIVLTRQDAERLGVDTNRLAYGGLANTANGTVRTARITLKKVRIGGVTDRNVTAVVNEGEMDTSLLGMRYLQRFARLEIANGTLILER